MSDITDLMEALKRSLEESGTRAPAPTPSLPPGGWKPVRYRKAEPKPVKKGQARLW